MFRIVVKANFRSSKPNLRNNMCQLLQNSLFVLSPFWLEYPEADRTNSRLNAWSEPVVVILTGPKRLVCKQTLSCIPIAAVIPQNEGSGTAMYLDGKAW
jgi:hypothetical protein